VLKEGVGNTWPRTPRIGDAGSVVHAEWDWYAVANGSDYYVYGLLAETSHLNCGRPDCGWAPNIQDRGPDATGPYLQSSYAHEGTWIDHGTTIPKLARGEWHHIEIDYTLGDDGSMFLTVDHGSPVNLPGPWGWDAVGNPGHAHSRRVVDEM